MQFGCLLFITLNVNCRGITDSLCQRCKDRYDVSRWKCNFAGFKKELLLVKSLPSVIFGEFVTLSYISVVYSCAYWTGISVSLQNWLSPAGTSVTPNESSSLPPSKPSPAATHQRWPLIFVSILKCHTGTDDKIKWSMFSSSLICPPVWAILAASAGSRFQRQLILLSNNLRCLSSFIML